MHLLNSKTTALAAATAVRLPRPASSPASFSLAAIKPKGARPALALPTTRPTQYRADQSRYQAKCRVAMTF